MNSPRKADDATGLEAVQHDLAVLLLQRDADALRDEVAEDRAQEEHRLQRMDDAFHREHEVRRDEVGRGRSPQHRVEDDTGHTDRRARRGVARALSDVVLALVARDPRLDEGVDRDEHDEQTEHEDRRDDAERPGVVEEDDVPVRRCQTQGAVGEADVPVRLRAGGDGDGSYGP